MAAICFAMATRHRPEQAVLSLSSALPLLHDGTVDLIVSDNSDAPSDALRVYCEENGIGYLRPPKVLSMSQHWDWVVRHAQGEAIHIMTDRGFLLEPEIRRLVALYQDSDAPVIFGSATFRERQLLGVPVHLISSLRYSGIVEQMPLARVIEAARQARISWPLPRLMNGIFPTDLLSAIRARFGAVCESFMPDVEFGMKSIMLQPDRPFIYADRIGKLSHSGQLSTGASFDKNTDNTAQTDFKQLSKLDQFTRSPHPADLSVPSGIAHEFNLVAESLGLDEHITAETLLAAKNERSEREDRGNSAFRRLRTVRALAKVDPTHQLYFGLGHDLAQTREHKFRYTNRLEDLFANIMGDRGL